MGWEGGKTRHKIARVWRSLIKHPWAKRAEEVERPKRKSFISKAKRRRQMARESRRRNRRR